MQSETLSEEQMHKLMDDSNIDHDMIDACRAYLSVMSVDDLSDFEESYNGQHDSDEDFAQQMADDLGLMPQGGQWPAYCIDWEYAARELMMDYAEENGYYFRNI